MVKNRPHRVRRRPRGKDQLLPMSDGRIRALSLEGHIALSVLRSGHGDAVQIGRLSQIVYLSYFMRDLTPAGSDSEPFRRAEHIIECCIARVMKGGQWGLKAEECVVMARILLLYDAQLAAAPAYRFVDAWEQFQRAVVNNFSTPIEGSSIEESNISIDVLTKLVHGPVPA